MIKGSCSLCGGLVIVPDVWMSVILPVPTCQSCGAEEQNDYSPIIPMKSKEKGSMLIIFTTNNVGKEF